MATYTYVDLEIDEARYLSNLSGIKYDLQTTTRWCDKYHELHCSKSLLPFIEPITIAILVQFMRAFGGGVRNKEARHLLSNLTAEQIQQYEYYRSYRDKHVAHSINEFEENSVRAYYIEGEIEKGINSIGTGGDRIIGLSDGDIESIVSICNTLLDALKIEIKSEKEKLLGIAKKLTVEEIESMSINMPKHPNDIDVSKGRC